MVALDGSSLPVGELLASGPEHPERTLRDRRTRWLAGGAALLVAAGLLAVPGLRAAEARDRRAADVVDVAALLSDVNATVDTADDTTSVVVRLSVQIRNAGPREVEVTAARVVPALAGASVAAPGDRVPAGQADVVLLDLATSCADAERLAELGRERTVEVVARAPSGRERVLAVDVSAPLQRIARSTCRRDPLAESLVVEAVASSLTSTRLTTTLELSRDTVLGGQLVAVRAPGLRVRTTGLPALLPETGLGEPLRVALEIEVQDCALLRLNPRGYLLQLGFEVADGSGVRRTVVQGTGDDRSRVNRLGAGLLSRNCGFDPLFRTA